MSIGTVITKGIGPGASVLFALTAGYAIGAAVVVTVCYEPTASIMRNVTVATLAAMTNTVVPAQGSMSNQLPVMSEMRNATVPASGTMRSTTVPATGAMASTLPVIAEMRNTVVASQGAMSGGPAASEADLC